MGGFFCWSGIVRLLVRIPVKLLERVGEPQKLQRYGRGHCGPCAQFAARQKLETETIFFRDMRGGAITLMENCLLKRVLV